MRALARGTYHLVAPEHYGTPKEIWGFRSARGEGRPLSTASAFLDRNRALLGISADDEGLLHQRTVHSLGASHVILQQHHLGRRVHRAYVTVHVARDDRVFLTKSRAMPRALLPPGADFRLSRVEAVDRARRALPRRALPRRTRRVRVHDYEELWFPHGERLLPACKVRLVRTRPSEEWIVYVNARTGGILSKYDNIAKARGRARVFAPSPVTALGGHGALLSAAGNPRRPPPHAYREVALYGLRETGYLDGTRVTTSATAASRRVRRPDRRFLFSAHQRGFEEVMAYHHIDAVIRHLRRLGFRGSRAIFREPLRVDVNGTPEDNSWYSPGNRTLTFGTGAIDDAEDGETIVHELGHAIQDAIVPDFGQSAEAAAMGEGFGDYLAASVFADRKPERYRTSVMTWDGLPIGLSLGLDPPCLRRVDHSWTYDDFDERDDEHDNGEIWSATLWDVREALGGDTADRLILESHFQLDGFTTMARGARAILDADRNLHAGAHRAALRRVFRGRRLGPV